MTSGRVIVLGVTGPKHDPAAALFIDGELVAAAEEERFVRKKHARKHAPVHAARFCLGHAGITGADVDHVAYPWCPDTWKRWRGRQFRRTALRQPWRSGVTWFKTARRFHRLRDRVAAALPEVTAPWTYVPHHRAHAASARLLSGYDDCAVLTCDGLGEYVTTRCADGPTTVHEEAMPHSLGCFYSALTEYLGWRFNNGEYKLMGMAPYGDARKVDLDGIAWVDEASGAFRLNPRYLWPARRDRYEGRRFTRRLVDRLGPPRSGDGLAEPYTHVAAATQRLLERAVHRILDTHLKSALARTRKLAFAGGTALNVALNRTLLARDDIDALFVQPAANDAGTALGAAAWVSAQHGAPPRPQRDTYLGPAYGDDAIERALGDAGVAFERCDAPARAAELLAEGAVVGWFDGRMEFGPRALGHRSILGHPGKPGTARRINERIKLREVWRPFCPSVLDRAAPAILGSNHPAPYMTIAFTIAEEWRTKIPEVVHVDGTARPQVVTAADSPRFWRLLEEFERRTGLPVLLNTSLNRRGEPMACGPADAIRLLTESELDHLFLGDYHARRAAR